LTVSTCLLRSSIKECISRGRLNDQVYSLQNLSEIQSTKDMTG